MIFLYNLAANSPPDPVLLMTWGVASLMQIAYCQESCAGQGALPSTGLQYVCTTSQTIVSTKVMA